ncbi:hypothetical protein CERSUDRAFT_100687 [Gelatoporia subvermispora B]|uniref:Uncharacterized protein n=1 Tax=Ceriporiopsis subvermispora (strain B) TaxID=914234 RepID=M2QX76_CERS8|nr:hypothetical protein CERSUDRAFT_100687 [Gelatoporia subvermispora B]
METSQFDLPRGQAKLIPRREGSRCDKVDRKHGSAFLTASGAGASGIDRLDIVHFLLKHGANLNFGDSREGEIALFVASRADHLDIMRLLVAYGADVNTPPSLPGVLRAGHLNIVRVLMEHGAVVNSKGEKTALLVASTAGHLDVVVRFLFDHGADVNVKASLETVITLFAASRAGHLGVQEPWSTESTCLETMLQSRPDSADLLQAQNVEDDSPMYSLPVSQVVLSRTLVVAPHRNLLLGITKTP